MENLGFLYAPRPEILAGLAPQASQAIAIYLESLPESPPTPEGNPPPPGIALLRLPHPFKEGLAQAMAFLGTQLCQWLGGLTP